MMEESNMKELSLQPVAIQQLSTAMALIEHGRAFLKAQGLDQWQGGYPDEASIRQDIQQQKGYFLTDGTHDMAYLCLDPDGEPAYREIKGQWLTPMEQKYVVIHRLAFDPAFRGCGLSAAVFALAQDFCRERGIQSIRVDTDPENKIMQHCMKKAGFIQCGTIFFAGSDKLAFEKVLDAQA